MTQTTTLRDAATPTPAPTWHSVLYQPAPDCNNPSGANWFVVDAHNTHVACQGGQLLMQQLLTSTDAHFAEHDVSDNQFSFTHFRAQVNVNFVTPTDVNTWAILGAQTPQSPTQYGGVNFEINSNGNWQLDQVTGYSTVSILGQGQFPIKAAGTTTLTLIEQNSTITAYINNSPMITAPDTLNPNPGACGLLVSDTRFVTSSPITFSNFGYDSWY